MGIGLRAFTAVGLAFAAILVVGCGTSQIKGGLSQSANTAISGDLSAVSNAVSDGSCARARSALTMLDTTLSKLPAGTNAQLVKNLRQGASTVQGLAVDECHGTTTPTTSSSTSATSSSASDTTSSTPTTPTTISTPTTEVTTTQSQSQSQSQSTPGTGSVTQLGGGGSATNGGGGLSGGQ